jgi:hypothetical protein
MKKDYTDITIILDRSGSMETIKKDMVEGVKNFVAEQAKLPGQCLLSLVQFDTVSYDNVFTAKPIQGVGDICLYPRGGTPLFDAVGRSVVETGKRFEALPEDERPEFVVVMIITDGEENSSQEFTSEMVKKLVQHQVDAYKWNFTYLGANQDALFAAQTMGIPMAAAFNYVANQAGVSAMYNSVNCATSSLRSHRSSTLSYNDQDKLAQKNAGLTK